MALKIYDVALDATRDATQADLDALVAVSNAYGRIMTSLTEIRGGLAFEMDKIRKSTLLAEAPTKANDAPASVEQG